MGTPRQLEMKYAGGGIVRHLGLQNYKGAVPALAELIANAWDADSEIVKITIPFGKSLTKSDVIIVKDFGAGMSYDECDNKYLVIARNRREVEQTDKTAKGRDLMAHKGLGKLAGFGIAKKMEVKTVSNKKTTSFEMSFEDLDRLKSGESYKPKMLADEVPVNAPNGTEIILKELTLERAISEKIFLQSMGARFSVYSKNFQVYINGKLLKKDKLNLEFKFPEKVDEEVNEIDKKGFGTTILSNGQTIKWWMGFTSDTIKIPAFAGVSVLARGRVAQDPSNFDLAGGAWGQHGLRYITGEIVADFVDEGFTYDSDTIITNRSGINFDNAKNRPLYDWSRNKIKELLRIWSDRRGQKTIEKVKTKYPELVEKIKQYPEREQKELNLAMKNFAEIPTIQPERLKDIFSYVIDGYQDKVFFDIVKDVSNLPPEARIKMFQILKEFDISEAIRTHKLVRSRVEVIRTFRSMINAGVPEKPDMHEHIRKYPWLLGVNYQAMSYENTLQQILIKEFKIDVTDNWSKKIPDFYCMRSGDNVIVIELKKPGEKIGRKELQQVSAYTNYLRSWADKGGVVDLSGKKISRKNIDGYLIGYELLNDSVVLEERDMYENVGIHTCLWYDVLDKTEQEHRDYLEIVKERAPKNDPRIIDLSNKLID